MTPRTHPLPTWLIALVFLAHPCAGKAADVRGNGVAEHRTGLSRFETAASLSTERWSIDWLPFRSPALSAVAAYDAEGRPLVLYDPERLKGRPRPIAKFVAMRQEVVLLVAEGARKQKIALRPIERDKTGPASTLAGAMTVVPEEVVYPLVARYGAFGNVSQIPFAAHVIDCVALLFLAPDERATVAFYANERTRFFDDAFAPPHDLMERGRALTDCPALDPGYDPDRARRSFLQDWDAPSR